jgi:hypothetical protein
MIKLPIMKKNLIYFLALLLVSANELMAQPTLPGSSGDGPGNVDDVPLHFLIYPLLLLGAFLGAKYFKKEK